MAWVFFRANSLEQAYHILAEMLSFGTSSASSLTADVGVILGAAIAWELAVFLKIDVPLWAAVEQRRMVTVFTMAVVIVAVVFLRGPGAQFIYFQF